MIHLDEARLVQALGAAAVERGREYVRKGRVLEAHLDVNGQVRGIVKGSEWKPYEQKIAFDVSAIDGLCTCPVGANCKHVAAVLLDLMGADEVVDLAPEKADPQVSKWLESVQNLFTDPNAYPPDVPLRVFYVLSRDEKGVSVEIVSTRALKTGGYGKTSRVNLNAIYSHQWPRHVMPIDVRIIEAVAKGLGRAGYEARYRLAGGDGARTLPEMVASGRCVWEDVNTPPLALGPIRKGGLAWTEAGDGSQTLRLAVSGPDATALEPITTTPPWYLDREAGLLGELSFELPAPLVAALLQAPPIRPEGVETVRTNLARLLPDHPGLLPEERRVERRQVRPTPVLRIRMMDCVYMGYGAWRKPAVNAEHRLPVGRVLFDYDGVDVRQGALGAEVRRREDDAIVIMPRRPRLEGRATTPLLGSGWSPARTAYNWRMPKGYAEDYLFAPESDAHPETYRLPFYRFLRIEVPLLREQGWRVDLEEGLDLTEPTEWRVEVSESGNEWFDLDLGVIVDGERIPLLPILLEALSELKGISVDDIRDDFELYHPLLDGRTLVLGGDRLRPLLKTLGELFGKPGDWPEKLRLEPTQAGELAGLEWELPERLAALRDRLANFEALADVSPPASLKGDLRPYQRQGLAWLQFLREYEFGGVLADDMGLGKTVQTLAHVLVEHEAGRLDRPVLIVAPTSTLPNWRAEAERFAPTLRTLVLRGADRKALFAEIAAHDLIVTSYPLLARDRERFAEHEFHLVVLDEAQNIKNPAAAVAQAAKSLKTRYRVCLSGTPVENRLEELWSLFDFLMPGFLGNLTRFRKTFKTPIEAHGDADASRRLSRRVRPFVLRRTKDLVAKELPEKTTLVERVELTGSQRDLYESLRLAMDERIRDLVAKKGFEKSRIEILDALLRLRQACCDPRLIKLDTAKKVKGSAKLERLMELLGELVQEGRRVLIFSQFTTMLDLIEDELKAAEIEWVRISGDTEDRETPVQRFQAGEVPVFLISLRAGGTGLNLTAADTVVHYDPWWNPAVEAQATDRAHRIGQTKSVLVLKLVAEGTVEEKILDLQEKKARLAESILGGGDFEAALTADELQSIFQE